jgi:hypothetical protein
VRQERSASRSAGVLYQAALLEEGDRGRCCLLARRAIRHIAFAVEGIDDVVARLRARGAELVGKTMGKRRRPR